MSQLQESMAHLGSQKSLSLAQTGMQRVGEYGKTDLESSEGLWIRLCVLTKEIVRGSGEQVDIWKHEM